MTAKSHVRDLSSAHHPITNLFLTAPTGNEFRLNADQLEFYETNGYLAGVRLLDDEQIEFLRHELSQLIDPSNPARDLFYEFNSNESTDPNKVLFHALGAWRVSPGFHDLLWHARLLVPAAQLLHGDVRFWHDQIFFKPAQHGGLVAWHQDYSYWTRTQPMAHLSCWIGLDDSNVANGCVHYVPGSHRWDLLPITGLANDMNAIQSVLNAAQTEHFKPVAIELKKGEASFHHPLMVHGSFENTTAWPRRAVVINLVRDGVHSASNDPLLDGIPLIPAGQKLQGQFFPLLFQANEFD